MYTTRTRTRTHAHMHTHPLMHTPSLTCACAQVERWDIEHVRVETSAGREAQDYLCKHAQRIRRLAALQAERRARDRTLGKLRTANFSWIGKREVALS